MALGTKVGDVYFEAHADTADAEKNISNNLSNAGTKAGTGFGTKFGKAFTSTASKIGAGLLAAWGLDKVVDVFTSSISEASSLQQATQKVQAVFGDLSPAILDWGKTASTTFGQSTQQALAYAGSFGNLFTAFGIGKEQASLMSTTLVQLAADLASFNDTSVEEALMALRSGLTGEMEPMKRYGSVLSDVRLKQEAFNMGLIDNPKQSTILDPAIKSMAAFSLVMKDTTTQQGDFARTQDQLATKQKVVTAQWNDAKAAVGMVLLPAMTALAQLAIDELIPAFRKLAEWMPKAWQWLMDNQPVLIGIISGLGALIVSVFTAIGIAVISATWPFLLIGAAIAGLVAGVIYAYQEWEWFRTVVDAVAQWFMNTWLPMMMEAWGWLADNVPPILQAIADFITGTLVPAFVTAFQWINDNVVPIFQAIADFIVNSLIPALVDLVGWINDNVIPVFVDVYNFIKDNVVPIFMALVDAIQVYVITVISALVDKVIEIWDWWQVLWDRSDSFRDFLVTYFQAAWEIVKLAVEGARGAIETVWDWIQKLWDKAEPFRNFLVTAFWLALENLISAWGVIADAISLVWTWFQTVWDKGVEVANFFKDVFKGTLEDVAGGFGAISTAAGAVRDAIQWVIDKAKAAIGPLERLIDVMGRVINALPGVGGFAGLPSGGGGNGGGVGANAAGGPMSAGSTSWVGERGPELFTTRRSGWIIPNHDIVARANSGGSVNIGSMSISVQGAVDYEAAYQGAQEGTLAALGQYIRARG